MNLDCHYPRGRPGFLSQDDFGLEPIDPLLLQMDASTLQLDAGVGLGSPESPGHSPATAGSPSSSSSSIPATSLLALPLSRHGRTLEYSPLRSPLRSPVAQTLAPLELDLLKHYLEHTSKDPTVDDDDRYTLQIGIPNLACQSKPLMRSVLAIAAVCKCCDIISQPSVSREERGHVKELLSLAQSYHVESLHDIQATLHGSTKHWDQVLANAAMMGMYGSGSHRARIWLATTATFSDQATGDLMPKHSQWISLFRAAHLAYAGLLTNNGTPRSDNARQPSPAHSPTDPLAARSPQTQYEYKISPRVEQSRGPTAHALAPILAATIGSALNRLREKAREAAMVSATDITNSFDPTSVCTNEDLQVCFAALSLFSGIVTETFRVDDSRPSTPGHANFAFELEIDPSVGRLAEVSPWLRRYAASISSSIPSRLPRRIIMAFIHKAPARFLSMIEEAMALVRPESPIDPEVLGWGAAPEPSLAHQLALEIFAHWLVLVILLDNVWWIGGIGAWELGRLVMVRKDMRWGACMWNQDEDWWPESMFEVSRQFDKHRTIV